MQLPPSQPGENFAAISPPEDNSPDTKALADGAPRGEVFDWIETAPASKKPPVWGWPLAMTGLALAYCLYLLGAIVGSSSRQPLPVGPFPAATPAKIRVQIAGQVRKPGVYELGADARVQDLLKKAGGPLPKADVGALNLAAWPEDGAKITVPLRASAQPTPVVIVQRVEVPFEVPVAAPPVENSGADTSEIAPQTPSVAAPKTPGAPRATTKSGAKSQNASLEFLRKNPLDLNRAPLSQLEQLPGIGPKTAERIIAYRSENGRFGSVDELDQVKGIGAGKLAKLKGLIYVR